MELVTADYLNSHLDHMFVFGDNTQHKGNKGAASLRYLPNTYGFITKKFPCNEPKCFYTYDEYVVIYENEIDKLLRVIESNPQKTYLISKLGSGLANRNFIFESVIEPRIKLDLSGHSNIRFLW